MKRILDNKKVIWILGFFFCVLFLVVQQFLHSDQSLEKPKEIIQIDTMIPKRFVLIPIQIQNLETTASIIGEKGMVDLWTFDRATMKRTKKVASKVRIIRAPLNPGLYAILVPEDESGTILEFGDEFFVTVQSMSSDEMSIVKRKKSGQQQIETFETN